MADGTRLAKIESELAPMETELREAKEHRQSFQESINAQFAQMCTPMDQRIKIASFYMVGPAYSWYKWVICNQYTQDWGVFVQAVQRRFGSDLYDNPQEALKELKQTGLTDYLKCQLRLARPATYPDVVALARLHEQNHLALQHSLKPSPPITSPPFIRPRSTLPPSSTPVPKPPLAVLEKSLVPSIPSNVTMPKTTPPTRSLSPNKNQYKKFTAAELRERRHQGLCYYCNEKYNPSHNCRAQCYVLLAPEDVTGVFSVLDIDSQGLDEQTVEPEVSFNALSGEYHPSTLRLKGFYQSQSVNVLVDSGSTFNFIKPSVAQHLHLPSSGVSFTVDIFHLDIASADVVFGVAWLKSLHRVLTDYDLNTIEFIYSDLRVANNSDPALLDLHHQHQNGSASVEDVDLDLTNRTRIHEQLQDHIARAQARMRKYADAKRMAKSYEVGQWVWVKFHHYRQHSATKRLNYKLSKRYHGPFCITAKIGSVAYQLELPSDYKIHPVFHISLLKSYNGPIPPTHVDTADFSSPNTPQPKLIVAERTIHDSTGAKYQVLVEWEGQTRDDATWEDWDVLETLYSTQALEDKVLFHGRGNDTTHAKKEAHTCVRGAPSWAKDFVT
ncbi:Chromo-like domain superfamily [Sesbania bispinosa]|nr:Chromo-like domain superfamily [Sesbania bispinosa]